MLIPFYFHYKHISFFSHTSYILSLLPQIPITILLLCSLLPTYLLPYQGRIPCLGWRLIIGLALLLLSIFNFKVSTIKAIHDKISVHQRPV